MVNYQRNLASVEKAFSRERLAQVCTLHETRFGEVYDLERYEVEQQAPSNYYYYRNNGSSVLAVAHLDTVVKHDERGATFADTEAGPIVFSGALDDRLGAYTLLDLLPALGIRYDVLLTAGEESGQSTASFFDPPRGKDYDWIIEFDRGGTDVVMYDYEDDDAIALVRRTRAQVGWGSFSDICYLEHLGVKGFNWGVGYRDYHSTRGHAYLDDYFEMIARYLKFDQQNAGTYMPHTPKPAQHSGIGVSTSTTIRAVRWDSKDHYNAEESVLDPWHYADAPTARDLSILEERLDYEAALARLDRGDSSADDVDLVDDYERSHDDARPRRKDVYEAVLERLDRDVFGVESRDPRLDPEWVESVRVEGGL